MEELTEEEPDQYLGEKFSSKAEEMLYKKLYWKIMNDLKQKGDNTKTPKYRRLISEYKKFKRDNVLHFRFNSASNQTAFG